ncbi:hypothetical protein GF351_03405 [Candidatus Woesearchaeota archaeon]|nr:hypothetical protein [Candidatus Woesearchaeota archaeon]
MQEQTQTNPGDIENMVSVRPVITFMYGQLRVIDLYQYHKCRMSCERKAADRDLVFARDHPENREMYLDYAVRHVNCVMQHAVQAVQCMDAEVPESLDNYTFEQRYYIAQIERMKEEDDDELLGLRIELNQASRRRDTAAVLSVSQEIDRIMGA